MISTPYSPHLFPAAVVPELELLWRAIAGSLGVQRLAKQDKVANTGEQGQGRPRGEQAGHGPLPLASSTKPSTLEPVGPLPWPCQDRGVRHSTARSAQAAAASKLRCGCALSLYRGTAASVGFGAA